MYICGLRSIVCFSLFFLLLLYGTETVAKWDAAYSVSDVEYSFETPCPSNKPQKEWSKCRADYIYKKTLEYDKKFQKQSNLKSFVRFYHYVGDFLNGKRHGLGRSSFAPTREKLDKPSRTFFGEFFEGKAFGRFIIFEYDRRTYLCGNYDAGKRVGYWTKYERETGGYLRQDTYFKGGVKADRTPPNKVECKMRSRASREKYFASLPPIIQAREKRARNAKAKLTSGISFIRNYQARKKTLLEEVYNYASYGRRIGCIPGEGGEMSLLGCVLPNGFGLWVQDPTDPCVLKNIPMDSKMNFSSTKTVNHRAINETAFRVWIHSGIYRSVSEDFVINGPSSIDMTRLRKAWRLAFRKCPVKKSSF